MQTKILSLESDIHVLEDEMKQIKSTHDVRTRNFNERISQLEDQKAHLLHR